MKYIYQTLIAFMMIAFSSCTTSKYYQGTPEDSYQYDQQPTITYQQFYNDLSPYGSWINYGNYGYVWQPHLYNFRPYYTNGQWVYTDYGWTWASNYNWGWAPFHYGRWINDLSYGWMWVPGYEWAPAWVSWRGGGDYYGWAPLGPGMNANYAGSALPYNYWTFVPRRYINSSRINDYYVNPGRNYSIMNNTRIINNINQNRNRPSYNQGPTVREVQRSTAAPVRKFNVIESNKPEAAQVDNNSIRVFRPAVNEQASGRPSVRPEKVTDLNQLKRTSDENDSKTNEEKNARPAPVREFPKEQTPQVRRNKPAVNNAPVTRDPSPAEVLPQVEKKQPVEQNRNLEPEKQKNQNAPVRNLNNGQSQRNIAPVQENPKKNEPQPERPVRRQENTPEKQPARHNTTVTPPANNVKQNPVKNSPSSQPVRRLNTNSSSTTQPVANEKKEVREVRPAHRR